MLGEKERQSSPHSAPIVTPVRQGRVSANSISPSGSLDGINTGNSADDRTTDMVQNSDGRRSPLFGEGGEHTSSNKSMDRDRLRFTRERLDRSRRVGGGGRPVDDCDSFFYLAVEWIVMTASWLEMETRKICTPEHDTRSLVANGLILHEYAAEDNAELISKELNERNFKNRAQGIDALNDLGFTPLMVACMHGKAHACQVLLSRGANPNIIEFGSSNTALMFACENGHVAVVDLMLSMDMSKSVSIHTAPRERDGMSLLMIAIKHNNMDMAELLIRRGLYDEDCRNKEGKSAFDLLNSEEAKKRLLDALAAEKRSK